MCEHNWFIAVLNLAQLLGWAAPGVFTASWPGLHSMLDRWSYCKMSPGCFLSQDIGTGSRSIAWPRSHLSLQVSWKTLLYTLTQINVCFTGLITDLIAVYIYMRLQPRGRCWCIWSCLVTIQNTRIRITCALWQITSMQNARQLDGDLKSVRKWVSECVFEPFESCNYWWSLTRAKQCLLNHADHSILQHIKGRFRNFLVLLLYDCVCRNSRGCESNV